jgi:hypothetical protein
MNFAPAHILPTAPAVHCAPGRCDICDGQFLAVTYQANSLNGPQTAPLPHRRTCRLAYRPDHPGIDVQTHSLEAASKFFVVCPGREEGIYTSAYVVLYFFTTHALTGDAFGFVAPPRVSRPKASATAATRRWPPSPKPTRSGPCRAYAGTGMSAAASVLRASTRAGSIGR